MTGILAYTFKHFSVRTFLNCTKVCYCTQSWNQFAYKSGVQSLAQFQTSTILNANHLHFKPRTIHITNIAKHKSVLQTRGYKSSHDSKSYINPVIDLQKYVSVPIFPEGHTVFNPSDAEIEKGRMIFEDTGGSYVKSPVRFVGSFNDGSQVPDLKLPEVCFLGRSNVGKSSLIRALLNAHQNVSVRVSKRPGHTRKLNLFGVGRHFTLVDMPGYGHHMPANFQSSVETYLTNSRRLCRTFLLVDGEVGLTSTDVIALDMLRQFAIPYVVVLTKIDKAGRHKLLRNLLRVMETCRETGGHTIFSQPFLVSCKTGDGVIYLQTFIACVTGCIQVSGM